MRNNPFSLTKSMELIFGCKSFIQLLCVCVCVYSCTHVPLDALSVRVLVDKWLIGIDCNLENAALHFSLYETTGHLGGNPELLCQKKCITEGHKLQFRGFTVQAYTSAHPLHTCIHT